MSNANSTTARKLRLSLDSWAVLIALAAALGVRLGVLRHISW